MRTMARVPASPPGTGPGGYGQLTPGPGRWPWSGRPRSGSVAARLARGDAAPGELGGRPTGAGPGCAPRAVRPSRTTLEHRARAPVAPAAWALVASFALPPGSGGRRAGPPVAGDHRARAALRGLGRLRAGPSDPVAGAVPGRRAGLPRRRRGLGRHCEGGPPPAGLPLCHRPDDGGPLPLRRVRPAGAGGPCRRVLGGPTAGAACLGAARGCRWWRPGSPMRAAAGHPAAGRLELVATSVMATAGVLVGLLQIHLASRRGPQSWPRALMATSGLSPLADGAWRGSTPRDRSRGPPGSTSRRCSATTGPSTPWGSHCPAAGLASDTGRKGGGRSMRVIIAGGTGFLGRHVAEALVAAGHAVLLLAGEHARPRGRRRGDRAGRCRLGRLPLEAMRGCDAIVNLIGIKREQGTQTFERVHVEATRHLIEAAGDSAFAASSTSASSEPARPEERLPRHQVAGRGVGPPSGLDARSSSRG